MIGFLVVHFILNFRFPKGICIYMYIYLYLCMYVRVLLGVSSFVYLFICRSYRIADLMLCNHSFAPYTPKDNISSILFATFGGLF